MSDTNKCHEDTSISTWSAIKSFFKVVGSGLQTAAHATEGLAHTAKHWADEANDKNCISLIHRMGITHADGSEISDLPLVRLICDAYLKHDKPNQVLMEIVHKFNLDATKFLELQAIKKALDNF